jgi:hypothetical protein
MTPAPSRTAAGARLAEPARVRPLHVFTLLLAGCAPVAGPGAACEGEKCDTPEGTAGEVCPLRRADAFAPGRLAFTGEHVRWACADVKGVTTRGGDDRGQEYCEYYALVEKAPGEVVELGRNTGGGTTPLALELDAAEEDRLRADLDAVVGRCVFTSWHSDIPGPLPICRSGGCPALLGDLRLNTEMMRMKVDFNSNGAAADLVEQCYAELGDAQPDPYLRACEAVHEAFGTGWRRSDPSICAAVNRLFECGCGIDSDGDGAVNVTSAAGVARLLVPQEGLRGFPLGTWSAPDELPTGCRYEDTGDGSRTAVTCDLTAGDVLRNKRDPKGQCRARWANDIVVHVPLPAERILCDGGCGAEPWKLTP